MIQPSKSGGGSGMLHVVLGLTGSNNTHILECDTDTLYLCSGVNATGWLSYNGTVQTKSKSRVGNTYYGYGQCYARYDGNWEKGATVIFNSSQNNDNRGGAVLIYSDTASEEVSIS